MATQTPCLAKQPPVYMPLIRSCRRQVDPVSESFIALEKAKTAEPYGRLNSGKALGKLILAFQVAAGWQLAACGCNSAFHNVCGNNAYRLSASRLYASLPPKACKTLVVGVSERVLDLSMAVHNISHARTRTDSFLDTTENVQKEGSRDAATVAPMALNILRAYVKNALSARSFSAGLLGVAADTLVQLHTTSATLGTLDLQRSLSFMVFGVCYLGGFQPLVYRTFDRVFGDNVLRKTLADMFGYGPLLYLPAFYIITGMVQGLDWSQSWVRLSEKYVGTLLSYWKLWPLPVWAMFRWIPNQWRVLYLSSLGFIEKCIYSYLGH